MRKKLPNYGMAALIIVVVFLVHNILGRPGAHVAIATPSSYADHTAIPEKTIRILKTVSRRPDNLLQVTAQDVRALLAEPELVREELPTVVWQYRTEACVLDLYLRAEEGNDAEAAPVVHYEIRAREEGVSNSRVRRSCVRDLISQRSTRMVDVSAIYKRD